MRAAGTNPAEVRPDNSERRRGVRYKVELPAYASLAGIMSTQAPAWMKIIDISECGMAIQPPFPLEPGLRRASWLKLPHSPALIATEAEVIRTDASWRVGIQFRAMPEQSLLGLKHWLWSNRTPGRGEQTLESPLPLLVPPADECTSGMAALEDQGIRAHPDYTALLAAVEAVQPQLQAVGADRDAALQLIARRAQTFTQANGAALALAEGEEMVCRASVDDAPPTGAHFRIGSGFSGECVRSGWPLRCDDSETDPRVDRYSCRFLGIRAILAVPIRSQSAIIGLLEVFSRHPHAFRSEDEFILLRLAKMAAAAAQAGSRVGSAIQSPAVADDFACETLPDPSPLRRVPGWIGLLTKVAITTAFVVFGVIRIWEGDGLRPGRTLAGPTTGDRIRPLDTSNAHLTTGLPELLQLADEGDAAAQFALGVRYEMGSGVPQDDEEAVHWFNKAAEQDDPGAQGMLGAYYWAGRGIPADLVKAYFWSILAEAGGDEASKSRLPLLASRLNQNQILDAQQQASDWIAQHRASRAPEGPTAQ